MHTIGNATQLSISNGSNSGQVTLHLQNILERIRATKAKSTLGIHFPSGNFLQLIGNNAEASWHGKTTDSIP